MSSQAEADTAQSLRSRQQKRQHDGKLCGTVKMFKNSYGFIKIRRSDDDVYVKTEDIQGVDWLREGQSVTFRMETQEEGDQTKTLAREVEVVKRTPLQRVRGDCSRSLLGQPAASQNLPPVHVRVVTYNLLAPSCCEDHPTNNCRAEDLDEPVRWGRILDKIQNAIAEDRPTVICLQEVEEIWALKLYVYFQKQNWHFIHAGDCGVAMAFPNESLELEEVQMITLSDYLQNDYPPDDFSNLDPWNVAWRRHNRFLSVLLRKRDSTRCFAVLTYHMPCLVDGFSCDPQERELGLVRCRARTVHTALLRYAAEEFANGFSLILAGDFNTKPGDSQLRLVKEFRLDGQDVNYPPDKGDLKLSSWFPPAGKHVMQLSSAYQKRLGHEPAFTNFVVEKDPKEPFRETIDYIFVSEDIRVEAVGSTPSVPEEGQPSYYTGYPSKDEPSDHVLIQADLQIG